MFAGLATIQRSWVSLGKVVPRDHFWSMAELVPSSSPCTGARAYGEGTPASLFPHGHGRLERHFPRLPR